MEIWIEKSKQKKMLLYSLILTFIGISLITLFHNSAKSLNTDSGTGLLLGILLFILGLYPLITNKKQEIIIDPNKKLIFIKNSNHFYKKDTTINFDEITEIKIGYLGKKSNFVKNYYLILSLKNGKECSIFGPGFYGINERYIAEEKKDKLLNYIKN